MSEGREVWYRYWDADHTIELEEYPVVCHTPKGVWLHTGYPFQFPKNADEERRERALKRMRFALKDARRRFAYPTKELAWDSFLKRKHARVGWLQMNLEKAQQALEFARSTPEPPRSGVRFRDPRDCY